jgi:hypothetical protein
MKLLGVATIALLGCEPKTIDYAVVVHNDYPGTRVGIFRESGGPPLATTTLAKATLTVTVGFKEELTARFVDAPELPGVKLQGAQIDSEDRRASAKERRPVTRHLFASLDKSERQYGWVELVLASATDEVITVGAVSVDTNVRPPGSRLIVPTKTDGAVSVTVGSEVIQVELGGREIPATSPYPPNALLYVDPTSTACLQTRDVFYGAAHLIGAKPEVPKRLPPKKVHVFRGKDIPDVLVDEKVPDSISGTGIGYRNVFERCPPARRARGATR